MTGSQVTERSDAKAAIARHSLKSIAALVALCAPFAWLAFEWIRDLFQNREHAMIWGLVALEFLAFGVWSYGKGRPRSQMAGQASETGRPIRWIPTSKQWLVIWLSAILATLVIIASVTDGTPTEAIAGLIPLGLGALGVWHLETRRKG